MILRMKMETNSYMIVGVCLYLAALTTFVSAITFPPTFTQLPPKNAVFIPGEAILLPCVAIASPAPRYVWNKNGKLFNWAANTGRYTKWPDQGTLVIARPGTDDDGIYQCFAINQFGVAQSNTINVRRAEMGDFEAVRTKEIAVQHGEPVTLPCSVPLGYPPPVVTWIMEKNSQIQYLKETNRRATDINGFLYIAAVIEEDHDTLYTCVANNEVLRHQKNGPSYKIKVYGQQTNYALRSLYRTPRTEVAIAGDTLQLKCIYGGFPTPQYTWFKDDKENIELPNVAIKNTGTMLEISPVNEEAAGQYRCQGSNEQTRTTLNSQYTVHVQVRPTFVEKPEDITVPVNGSVTFRCTAKGTPTPQIRWTVNGEDPAGYIDGVRKTLSGSVMRLYNLTVKDTAVIQCNASNAFGYDLVNAYVNVMREPPYFIKPPQTELRVVDGHEVTLNCQTFSAPKAVISWSKDGRPINGGRYRSLPNGDLRIAAAANTDSGIYECTATNPFGSRKASGRLLVRRRTRIVLAPIDTQVYENQVVKFVCTAETDPVEAENLKITWYKDNNLIMPDVTPRIQPVWFDYSLVLSGAQPRDTGQYRCNASNGLDFAVASASLLVQGAPEQAIRVQVNCVEFINEELALVSWYPGSDNYSPIMEYIVEYSTQYERETWYPAEIFNYTGLVQSTSTKVLLRPAILYWFRVRTRNRVGTSLPSSPTTTECGIPPRVPEVNPRELYVYGSMRNNMIIRWTTLPYIEHYGSNLGYELTIACLNCDIIPKSAINHTVIGDWRTDRITLTSFRVGRTIYELETFKQFRVTIQSRNEKGMSTAPPTVAFGYSGEAVPTISPPTPTVINVTGQGAVLQWQALTEAQAVQVNGYFRGYRIEWCDASATSTQCAAGTRFQDVLVRIPTTPVLYNRRRRSISIQEEEQASANDTNDWHDVHSSAEESVLDRYLSNTSKPTSRTYAPFWSRYSISPICGTNPVRAISCPGAGRFPRAAQSPSILGDAYDSVVSRMPRQTTSPRVPQSVTGTQKSAPFVYGQTITHTLTGVPGASTARVWLRVLNTRFAGPMGGTVEITTLEDTPGPVANLRSTGVGVTFAEITWTPPSEPNGIVLGYEFEAMELKGLEMGFGFRYPRVTNGTLTSFQLTGLRPSTTYRATIWPFTSAGIGVDNFIDFSTAPSDVAPTAPTFIVMAIGATNFTVLYEPSHVGIPGTVFFVQYRQPGVVHWLESERMFGQREITVHTLASNTVYEVRMVATNGGELSTPSVVRLVQTLGLPGADSLTGSNATWFIIVCALLIFFGAILILLVLLRRYRLVAVQKKAADPRAPLLASTPEYAQPNDLPEDVPVRSDDLNGYQSSPTERTDSQLAQRPVSMSRGQQDQWSPSDTEQRSDAEHPASTTRPRPNGYRGWDDDADLVDVHEESDSALRSKEEEEELDWENSYIASGSELGSMESSPRRQVPAIPSGAYRRPSRIGEVGRLAPEESYPANTSTYSHVSGDPTVI